MKTDERVNQLILGLTQVFWSPKAGSLLTHTMSVYVAQLTCSVPGSGRRQLSTLTQVLYLSTKNLYLIGGFSSHAT